jgi:hypothetical protein
MSRVTNVILTLYGSTYHMQKNLNSFVEKLNKECFDDGNFGFIPVDIGSVDKITGGSKYTNGLILIGGFNYLNIKKLIEGVKNFDFDSFSKENNISRPYFIDIFYHIEDCEDGYKHVHINLRD